MNLIAQRDDHQTLLISLWGGHDQLICSQLGPHTPLLEVYQWDDDPVTEAPGLFDCPSCRRRSEIGLRFKVFAPQSLYPTDVAFTIQSASDSLLRGASYSYFKPDSIVVMGDHRAIGISAKLATTFALAFVGAIASIYNDRIATTNNDSGATYYERSGTSGYVITTVNPRRTGEKSPDDGSPKAYGASQNDHQNDFSGELASDVEGPTRSNTALDKHNDGQSSLNRFDSFEIIETSGTTASLATSEVVLVVGGGLKSADAIEKVVAIAEKLNVGYGATRVICDAGLMDHSRQIGTTGITISPKLYIALGVSGQPQHLGGLENVGEGISFNLDKGAPINTFVDNAFISDGQEVLEHLYRIVMEQYDQ